MGNAPSNQGGTPPHLEASGSAPAPPLPLSKDKEPAKPSSPPPPPTPLLMPYGGHLSPQNPHALGLPQAHDYSKTIVTALILNQQLAPFYRGLDDFEEEWSETEVTNALAETREKDFAEQVQNSATSQLREERETVARGRRLAHEAERAERQRREEKAYLGALECPICFLFYPPNINTSRCCQQPLCTECFVQIKRAEATTTHLESESACCPFCVETDFGVIYERPTAALPTPSGILSPGLSTSPAPASALATSPECGTSAFSNALSDEPLSPGVSDFSAFREEGKRRKSVSSKAKEVVTIDAIRPDWETKLNAVKAQAARRAARRIVMRQVGDRLIPIGYTSSRATGQADFSMSIPPEEGGSRRSRRTREREREMEEVSGLVGLELTADDDHGGNAALAARPRGVPAQAGVEAWRAVPTSGGAVDGQRERERKQRAERHEFPDAEHEQPPLVARGRHADQLAAERGRARRQAPLQDHREPEQGELQVERALCAFANCAGQLDAERESRALVLHTQPRPGTAPGARPVAAQQHGHAPLPRRARDRARCRAGPPGGAGARRAL